MEETRGGESCAADRDATDPVPIHWFPDPPELIHGGNQGRGELCRLTVTLPTMYQYIGSLTRPIRYMEETFGEVLPATGRLWDFHPRERALTGRTSKSALELDCSRALGERLKA